MNILITGSSGFLGGHTAELYVKKGHNVFGISRSIETQAYPQYNLDVTDFAEIDRIVSEKSIEVIVHLAGKAIVQDCEKNPFDAYKTNSLGTAAILEAARINNVRIVLSVETDKVYGYQIEVPTNEKAIFNPNSPYEHSKVIAAELAEFYRKHYGVNVKSIRPANLYGPNDKAVSRIIPAALNNLREGKGIRLYDTAIKMQRDFIYVKDVAEALYILATKQSEWSVYNLSTNNPISMLDLADKITSSLYFDIPHTIIRKQQNYAEIPTQSIDGSRFTKEFKFTYTNLEEGIRETWKHLHLTA